ncbi:hypothetical protein D3C78_1431410 [compost metagenome]
MHDAPVATGLHPRQDAAGEQEGAGQVACQRQVPGRQLHVRHVGERLRTANHGHPGVIHQNVDLAELSMGPLGQRLDLRFVGEVGGHGASVYTFSLQLGGTLLDARTAGRD